MQTVIIESLNEFIARNGGRYYPMNNGRMVFKTGACIAAGGLDQRWDPPADKVARLHLQRRFWELKVRDSETDFNRLKAAMMGEGPVVPWSDRKYGPAPGDGIAALKHLQKVVLADRAELARVAEELDNLPEAREAREAREAAMEARQRAASRDAELKAAASAIHI